MNTRGGVRAIFIASVRVRVVSMRDCRSTLRYPGVQGMRLMEAPERLMTASTSSMTR